MDLFSWIQNADLSVLRFIRNNIANPVLDFLMPLVTLIGEDGILWIAIAIALLCFKRTRKAGFVMALSLIIGFVTVNLTIKPLVGRVRPYVVDSVPILVGGLSDGSFPSGHTTACFEGAVSLVLCGYKRWGYVSLVCAFLVGFSRLYLYVHFPSDVITGAVIGTAAAFLSFFIVNKLWDKYKKSKTL